MSALLTRWRQAGLVWPAVLALAGLAVLVGLGSWQMGRKAWKEGLIAQIAARTKAEPMPLSEALRRWHATGDVEYAHVRLSGRFLHAHERHVFALDDRLGPGFHIYTPLETPDKQLVLVNRGFVPASLEDALAQGRRPGGGEVDGDRPGAAADAAGLVRAGQRARAQQVLLARLSGHAGRRTGAGQGRSRCPCRSSSTRMRARKPGGFPAAA